MAKTIEAKLGSKIPQAFHNETSLARSLARSLALFVLFVFFVLLALLVFGRDSTADLDCVVKRN